MKYFRIFLLLQLISLLIFIPSEVSYASEYDTWEENFQKCVNDGAKNIYIFIVVDESGSLESYFINNPDKGKPKDPKTDNGLPLRVIAIENFLKDLTSVSENIKSRGIAINVAIAGFGNADHNNWYSVRSDDTFNPYVPFTEINNQSVSLVIDEVKKQFTNDKGHSTFVDLPIIGTDNEFKKLEKDSCKVLIFFTDGNNFYWTTDRPSTFCESINSLREQENTFLLGVHLGSENDSAGFQQLKNIFSNEYVSSWITADNVSEGNQSNKDKKESYSCNYEPDNSRKSKIYKADEKISLDAVFKDIGGSIIDSNFEESANGPKEEITLCNENQVKTEENCVFNFRMGPSARFFSITASLKENGSPAKVENLLFNIIPPGSFSNKEIELNSGLSGIAENILKQVEITANYYGTYVRFDFKTLVDEPTWVGTWGIAGFQQDSANKVLSFSSKLTSGYFVELDSVDEVLRTGATHCFLLKLEAANEQLESIDSRYFKNLNVELYSLVDDKQISSNNYSLESDGNEVCINFKNIEPQDIKLKPTVDIIGISNADSSEDFYYPYESIPKIIQLQDRATPPTVEITQDNNRQPSARFNAEQNVSFVIKGGNIDQSIAWYLDNSLDLGEVFIKIEGKTYTQEEKIVIEAEKEYQGDLIFRPNFNNQTKNLDFTFGFKIGNTELASSRVLQPYIELPISSILLNAIKYFLLGALLPALLLFFLFFNNRFIKFEPETKFGVIRLQYKKENEEFESEEEINFEKLTKPAKNKSAEERIKNFTIKFQNLLSKKLSVSISGSQKLLNDNSLTKSIKIADMQSLRGSYIGINRQDSQKFEVLVIAKTEDEFNKYVTEAKNLIKRFILANDNSREEEVGPERPGRRGDGPERPGRRGDGPERPGRRGDGPERPGRRGDGPERPGRRS